MKVTNLYVVHPQHEGRFFIGTFFSEDDANAWIDYEELDPVISALKSRGVCYDPEVDLEYVMEEIEVNGLLREII